MRLPKIGGYSLSIMNKQIKFPVTIDTAKLIGYVESIDGGMLQGWVHRKIAGIEPVSLVVVSQHGYVKGVADNPRPDVLFHHNDYLRSGFTLNIEGLASNDMSELIKAKIIFDEGDDKSAVFDLQIKNADLLRRRYQLHVESIDSNQISGWLLDHDQNEGKGAFPSPLVLSSHDGKNKIHMKMGNTREDVSQAYNGKAVWRVTGSIPLSQIIEKNEFQFLVSDGYNWMTVGEVITFKHLYGITPEKKKITGWVLDPNDISDKIVVRVSLPNDEFVETRATLFRADLKKHTGRDGFCGFHLDRPLEEDSKLTIYSPHSKRKSQFIIDSSSLMVKKIS